MTGPQDQAAAGRDRLRPGHGDREQVIETLKTAFVDGRLTRDELDTRTGRALAARTCADLPALTADIPAAPAAPAAQAVPAAPATAAANAIVAAPAAAGPARAPAPARQRRRPSPPVVVSVCLATTAAIWLSALFKPGEVGPAWTAVIVVLTVSCIFTALGMMACAVVNSLDQKPSHTELPRRQAGARPGMNAADTSSEIAVRPRGAGARGTRLPGDRRPASFG